MTAPNKAAASSVRRRGALDRLLVLLFAGGLVAITVFGTQSDLLIVDEACYIEWAMSGAPVPNDWIGMKLLPVLAIRAMVAMLEPGWTAIVTMRLAFGVFALLLALGVYEWRRAEGDAPATSAALTLLALGLPGWVYVTGRLMSEIPALASLAWGFAALRRAESASADGRASRYLLSGAALGAFLFAYLTRTTSIAAAGAFLGYRCLAALIGERSPTNGSTGLGPLARLAQSPALPVFAAYFLLVGVLFLTSPLPVAPFGTATGHVGIHQRIPVFRLNIAEFYLPFGVLGPLVLFLAPAAILLQCPSRRLVLALLWFAAAAAPFLVIWLRGSWMLPRHTTALALPLVHILAVSVSTLREAERLSRARIAVMLIVVLVLAGLWFGVHFLARKYVFWYHHGYQEIPGFLPWLLTTALAGGGLLICARFGESLAQLRPWLVSRLPLALLLALLLMAHRWLAAEGVAIDRSFVSPLEFERIAGSLTQDAPPVIAVPVAHYDGSLLQYALPEIRLLTLDAFDGLSVHLDRPEGDAERIFIHVRLTRRPDEVARLCAAMNERLRQTIFISEREGWMIYRCFAE